MRRRIDIMPSEVAHTKANKPQLIGGPVANPASADPAELPKFPLVQDVGVLTVVPEHWHWQWQPRHQVMTRLAQYFPVVWVSPARHWRDSLSFDAFQRPRKYRPISERDFTVLDASPFLPRFYFSQRLTDYSFRQNLHIARSMLRRRGCKKIILYLWRYEFARAIRHVSPNVSCYHIDDEYSFSAVDAPLSSDEAMLISEVDEVFIHSPALLEKKGHINPHTSFTPNGVDFALYGTAVAEPADIRDIPHPRIGYSGRLKRQLDWPLLKELASRHPDWNFVFVGAANDHADMMAHIRDLSSRSNVKFLGDKTTDELARYPQHFDVCIMPYTQDGYTRYIYPLKLHEYLASGRPSVGTPIPSLEPFRDLVNLAEGADVWSKAIANALSPIANSPEARSARQALAKSHDWSHVVRQIAEKLALAARRPEAD